MPEIHPDAFEDASVTAVLAQEDDRREAGDRHHHRGNEKRRRAPEVQQEPTPDQGTPQATPRKMCWMLCALPYTWLGSTSGYSPR